jgi:FkbM family methyltransferase
VTEEQSVASQGLRQKAPLAAIRLARRAFANTPVAKLPLVGWAYRKTVTLALGGDEEFTTDFRGMRLTVPGGDHVFTAGLAGGFYELIELDLFERLAAASRHVVDVGANIGIFACLGASRLPAGGRLTAFEPVPSNLELLQRNLAQNGVSERVTLEPVAVGEAAGETVIHLAAESGNHSLAAQVTGDRGASLPVRVTTLDEHFAGDPSVDLLKIDVEGFDGYVLRGAARLIREQQPTLLVEFVPTHLRKAGFPAEEFLDTVFDSYPNVFLIDEPRRRLDRRSRDELATYRDKEVNLNLVAVANPQHITIIEGYRQSN